MIKLKNIIFLLTLLVLMTCSNKEKEGWIEHTLNTIDYGEKALIHLNALKQIMLEDSKEHDVIVEQFNINRKELVFILDYTIKLVSDNPSQQNKLIEAYKILLVTSITNNNNNDDYKVEILSNIDNMILSINSYTATEKELLEIRKK
ncbi:MAG: hypothetical protein OCD02_04415 [Spirochaetaceae bacterium]